MLWRHLCLARAWSAAGLLTCAMFAAPAIAEPDDVPPPSDSVTETVRILDARRSGDLQLDARGQGQDRVRIQMRNTSNKRLNVILPPGLVAASATGQGRAGGGGGFQSMGLGTPTNRVGSFGQFRTTTNGSGFQSIPVSEDLRMSTVSVPAGKAVELTIPAVCLNFGMPTPTARDHFELVDVDDYSRDARVRKALRSLATLGTSQGVAQAVMWRVCNDVSFEMMSAQASKVMNVHEVALAARIVDALDGSASDGMLEAAYLAESRVFVQLRGDGPLAQDAKRLAESLDGIHILGLPARLVTDNDLPAPPAPALLVQVSLTSSKPGETRGRMVVARAVRGSGWTQLGKTSFVEGSTVTALDSVGLAKAVDHALASAFVNVKVARRGANTTTLKVENRLPFTLANVVVKAGGSSGAPPVTFSGLGIGPARSALAPIQAANATIDRVELNGL